MVPLQLLFPREGESLPEYPDSTIYIERLAHFVRGQELRQIRVASPFFLRTVEPPVNSVNGLMLEDIERLGKRIVFDC